MSAVILRLNVGNKAFIYRLYPNTNQARELAGMLETHRRLYNEALAQRKTAYETTKTSVKYGEQSAAYKAARLTNPYYARTNFSSAQATLRRLDRAYQAFFRRIKAGQTPGYPRFKARDRFDSFTFPSHGDGARLTSNRLRVQHIGTVRVNLHRPTEGAIKTLTVKRDAGKWYVVATCDLGEAAVAPNGLPATGIDVGLEAFLTTSEGERVANPRHLKAALPKLRAAQRSLSRKKRGGANRQKAVKKVARLHTAVRNRRKDHHFKTARSLVSRFGLIAVESLNVKKMLGNHRMARSIADAGWAGFLQTLKTQAESAGCEVVEVDCRYTSQECSGCGEIIAKDLGMRSHDCPCGLSIHRDVNAARNILARAKPARTGPVGVKSDTGLVFPRSPRL